MDIYQIPNYKFCQYLLCGAGFWPYQSLLNRMIFGLPTFLILVMALMGQVIAMFTKEVTAYYIIDVLPDISLTVSSVVILLDRYLNMDQIKEILDHIKNDWRNYNVPHDVDLMQTYAAFARRANLAYFIYTIIMDIIFITSSYLPPILDIVAPLNESRPSAFIYHVEFFINEEKYYNSIFFFMTFSILVQDYVFLANQVVFMLNMQHACGMFAILRSRLEQALHKDKIAKGHREQFITKGYLHVPKCGHTDVYRELTSYIDIHMRIIRLACIVGSCHSIFIFVIVTGGILVASLYLVHVLAFEDDFVRSVSSGSVVIGQIIYIFLNSYVGQNLADISVSLSDVIYKGCWYDLSVDVQKVLLLIMMRCTKPCVVSACKLYVLLVKSFSTFMQSATSYCMVIYQL